MLSLEERADLLVRVGELAQKREHKELLALLSSLPREDLLSEPELGLRLASRWFHQSRYVDARKLVDELEEPCRRGGFDQLYRRRLVLDAHLRVEAGELGRAEAAYNEALTLATAANDQRWIALATLDIGTITAIRGEWVAALTLFQRAIGALQQVGDLHNLAACHQNLGMVFREMGLHARADSHFDQASRLYANSTFDVSLRCANLLVERALAIYASGDSRRGEMTVRRALDQIGMLEDEGNSLGSYKGEALRVLGVILLGEGRVETARDVLTQALTHATQEGVALLEGEVCELLGQVEEAQQHTAESSVWFSRAVDLYHKLGADARADRVVRGLRRVELG